MTSCFERLVCTAALARAKQMLSAVMLLLLCASQVGCVFYPAMKHEAEAGCNAPAPQDAANIDYACVTKSISEMQDLLQYAGTYERTLGYTVVAGGTYAALEATQKNVNNALLKHVAIGLGALVGLNQVVAPEKQQDVLVAGINALRCVEKAARALDYAASHSQALDRDLATKYVRAAQARYGTGVVQIDNAVAGLVANRLKSQAAVSKAAADAKAQAGVAVYEAVVSIRDNVNTQLVTSKPDLKQLFDNQQAQVNGLIGNLVKQDSTHKEDQQRLVALAGPASEDPTLDPAKPAQDVFATCVAPTAPPSS